MGLDIAIYKKCHPLEQLCDREGGDYFEFYNRYPAKGLYPYTNDVELLYERKDNLYFKFLDSKHIGSYGTYNAFVNTLCSQIYGYNMWHNNNYYVVGKPFYYLFTLKTSFIDYKVCELLYYEFLEFEDIFKLTFDYRQFGYQYKKFISLLRIAKQKDHILVYE